MTLLIILCCSNLFAGNEIACDENDCFNDPCCLLTVTAINTSYFTISGPEDDTILLFDASRNRKVEYLPVHIGDKFPSLVSYAAERCAIKEISYGNFENLFHLKTLNLNGNGIEIIRNDVFYDLVGLESVFLGKYEH